MSVAGTDLDQRYSISFRECLAMQLLRADGWSMGELELVFETRNPMPHANGECQHRPINPNENPLEVADED